ncbi:MAG TPA: alpha/beta hydrolase [Candidatus Dormibacteraeota bacterium]|nr:alpha/beta hydrolase [Candidatus Dormibacteraeota bacterium]
MTAPAQSRLRSGLNVAEWPGDGPPILALHGNTSTHQSWSRLAAGFPGRRIVAPDLRGRGGSMDIGGPYGLAQHARDAVSLMDELDLRDVLLVGHSLGAFIAPLVATDAAGRVTRMVLLDGGPPVKLPFFFVKRVVRMAFQRQAREVAEPFESVDALLNGQWGAMLRDHPEELAEIRTWLDASVVGPEGEKRLPVDPAAIPVDGLSTFFDSDVREAATHLGAPAHLLYATWGAKDGARPFYTPARAAELERRVAGLTTTHVEGSNHLTLLFRPEVAQAVAGS